MAIPIDEGIESSDADRHHVVELLELLLERIGPMMKVAVRRRLAAKLNPSIRGSEDLAQDRTINNLCRLYCEHAETYYRRSNGLPTKEVSDIGYALRPLKKLFGRMLVSEFGPKSLREVREEMIRNGWCRRHINHQVGRIKQMFKWAVSHELAPPEKYHVLQSVDGLRVGRSAARESAPVKPVPQELINPVLAAVSSPVQAMIRLQLLTGMRPGEVTIMRTCDIDTNSQPWLYRPSHHKTEYLQHERLVFLGPKAQQLLTPFLMFEKPDQYLFRPAEADRERRNRLHANRKTPLSCGNVPGRNRKVRPKRQPGERYDTHAYAKAVMYGCRAAFPTPTDLSSERSKQWQLDHHWHPHRLRHNAATNLRKDFGLDVAQAVLGHKTLAVTQIYAEKDWESAKQVMSSVG